MASTVIGTSEIVATFMSSKNDHRTKLPVSLIKKFSARYGEILYFQKEVDVIVVAKHVSEGTNLLFQISVDVENRARLTEANLRQLGAVFGDELEFRFIDEDKATVKIRKQRLGNEEQNVLPIPEEVDSSQTYVEGATKQITINAYERNYKARHACITHYGLNCGVCNFNFEEKYGEVGKGFIHVHHLTPISSIGEKYELDPIRDLRPVCPNCHAMIHTRRQPYSIEEMKRILRTSLNEPHTE